MFHRISHHVFPHFSSVSPPALPLHPSLILLLIILLFLLIPLFSLFLCFPLPFVFLPFFLCLFNCTSLTLSPPKVRFSHLPFSSFSFSLSSIHFPLPRRLPPSPLLPSSIRHLILFYRPIERPVHIGRANRVVRNLGQIIIVAIL